MEWTALAIASMGISCLATGLTCVSLRRSWDLQVSSVRWLFSVFFTYQWLYCTARLAYLIYVAIAQPETRVSTADEEISHRYSVLGVYALLHFKVSHDAVVAVLLVLGDAALFGVAISTFPLAFELAELVSRSMDRGAEKEQLQIRRYFWVLHIVLALYVATQTTLAAVGGGYTKMAQRCFLSVYFVQFSSFLFMVWVVVRLKLAGRKYENVQGQFITSPIYQRLTRILAIYAVFSLQFQIASVVIYAMPTRESELIDYISASSIVYSFSGLALAVTTMCSQVCVLQVCRCCLPDDVEAQVEARLMQPGELLSPRDTQVLVESAEPPLVNPVFVFTDIESSSALWAMGDGLVMQRATEIHDNILRSLLMKYRGYEITTAGDAFQLAFHTIREAVEYCLDVQLQLLVASWPKELHGMLPATRKQRSGHRLLFCGLRVRMGIHDAVDADGPLVLDVHAVTGKMIYTGASEVIANEIGDLGAGGQVLATKRVADWLHMYEDLLAIECRVDRVGEYAIPLINAKLEVYSVVPEELVRRKKKFVTTLKKRTATHVHGTNIAARQQMHVAISMSTVAAQRRRECYEQRERQRTLQQQYNATTSSRGGGTNSGTGSNALLRPASHAVLTGLNRGTSYVRTSSM